MALDRNLLIWSLNRMRVDGHGSSDLCRVGGGRIGPLGKTEAALVVQRLEHARTLGGPMRLLLVLLTGRRRSRRALGGSHHQRPRAARRNSRRLRLA